MSHDPFLAYVDAAERHRACTAPDLTPAEVSMWARLEASGPGPEAWDGRRCPECDQGQIVDGPYEAETGWQYRGCTHCGFWS